MSRRRPARAAEAPGAIADAPRARAAILRFTNGGAIWRAGEFLFLAGDGFQDDVTPYEIVARTARTATAQRRSIGAPEELRLDAAELKATGRVWSPRKGAALYAHPTRWSAQDRAEAEAWAEHQRQERERRAREEEDADLDEQIRQRRGERAAEEDPDEVWERLKASLDERIRRVIEEHFRRAQQAAATWRPAAPAPTVAFAALGLAPGASEQDVKRAFRRLALEAHPDRGGSAESFIELKRNFDAALAAAGGA